MIWSNVAYDYSKGTIIYDPVNGKVYTEEQAKLLPAEIRRRLCIKGKKTGCWVYSIEELKELRGRE